MREEGEERSTESELARSQEGGGKDGAAELVNVSKASLSHPLIS
tara:strand:- start:204 stop:335 length:132 start_codon:yes stop_codon:yes gene_type:complete